MKETEKRFLYLRLLGASIALTVLIALVWSGLWQSRSVNLREVIALVVGFYALLLGIVLVVTGDLKRSLIEALGIVPASSAWLLFLRHFDDKNLALLLMLALTAAGMFLFGNRPGR